MNKTIFLLPLLLLSISLTNKSNAQDTLSSAMVAEANNPLASIKTINLHNYYSPKLVGIDDATSNTFWLRYAQPFKRFLVRASLPITSAPTNNQEHVSGLGDLNAFATYLAIKNSTTTLGVGPIISMPTATNQALGTGKWQLGAAVIIFEIVTPQLNIGGLITWQASIGGDGNRENTSFMALQPFAMFQIKGGTYLRSTGIMQFNFVNGDYNVPFGLGIGQVIKSGKLVFNIFAEPQFSVLYKGVGQPKLQFFFGLNTQF